MPPLLDQARTKHMIVLNFTYYLTGAQRSWLARLSGQAVERWIEVPVQVQENARPDPTQVTIKLVT